MDFLNKILKKGREKLKETFSETFEEGKNEFQESVAQVISNFVARKGGKTLEKTVPENWLGREKLIHEIIKKLTDDVGNFLGSCDDMFKFDLGEKKNMDLALSYLRQNEDLEKMRYKLVPKFVKEDFFFRNYFFRVFGLLNDCKNKSEVDTFLKKWNDVDKMGERCKKVVNKFLEIKEKVEEERLSQESDKSLKEEKKKNDNTIGEKEEGYEGSENNVSGKNLKPLEKPNTDNIGIHITLSMNNLEMLMGQIKEIHEHVHKLGKGKIKESIESLADGQMELLDSCAETSFAHKKKLGEYLLLIEDDEMMKKAVQLNDALKSAATNYIKLSMLIEKYKKTESKDSEIINSMKKWREDLKLELGVDDTSVVESKSKIDDGEDDDENRVMPWEE